MIIQAQYKIEDQMTGTGYLYRWCCFRLMETQLQMRFRMACRIRTGTRISEWIKNFI